MKEIIVNGVHLCVRTNIGFVFGFQILFDKQQY